MKRKTGNICYDGGGNGVYCTFAKVKIIDVNKGGPGYYTVEVLKDYGCIWKTSEKTIAALESTLFDSFDEAKKQVYKDMRIENNKDFLKLYFESWT
jgi:hypothetical protein